MVPVQGYSNTQVLRFDSMAGVFSDFVNVAVAEQFKARTTMMAAHWSCISLNATKCHRVLYDMWWDVIPHTDFEGRLWDRPWEAHPTDPPPQAARA